MSAETYIDTHPMRRAFIANQLDRLVNLIVEQGETLLQEAGIEFPSRAVSSVLLIGESNQISTAEIANALKQPHQLVTQRIELLIEIGVIGRAADSEDGRRKILKLTDKGVEQYGRLQTLLADAESAFAVLFEEIGCDLPNVALSTMEALSRSSILERVKSLRKSPTNTHYASESTPRG